MIRAVMLIRSGGRVPRAVKIARELKREQCVSDAYAVFGRFDVVAFFQGEDVRELFAYISKAAKLAGIISTETLVEGEGSQYSHDYGKGPFST